MSAQVAQLILNIKKEIFNPIASLMIAVALLYFLYGVFQYIQGADNEAMRTAGARHIGYGVFGLFIMVSAFGILNFICSSINC